MTSPSKYYSSSPVRHLEDRYYPTPLNTILQQPILSTPTSSLLYQNHALQRENKHLYLEYSRNKNNEIVQNQQNIRLKKDRDDLSQRLKNVELRSIAENQYKKRQIQNQERDIRFLRDEYQKENMILRDQITVLSNKYRQSEAQRVADIEALRKRYELASLEETGLLRKNTDDELKKVLSQQESSKRLLSQKENDLQHLLLLINKNSLDYTTNLQRLIQENTTLRAHLASVEDYKNKQIHEAQTKKQLQKSRNIGLMSHNKENKYFLQKEITRLSDELTQKSLNSEAMNKQVLKLQSTIQKNQRRYEDTIQAFREKYEAELKEKDFQIVREEKMHRQQIQSMVIKHVQLQEYLASRQNELQNSVRELDYLKEELKIRDKQIEELKENIDNIHMNHSKELSKVLSESKVKRRSGLNISVYSSSSLKDIEEAPQGSSIMKGGKLQRQSSLSNDGLYINPSDRLPVVKEELAVSQGHIDEDDDPEIRELIQHYQAMLAQYKKTKETEQKISMNRISQLRAKLDDKENQIRGLLQRYEPIMDVFVHKKPVQEERRQRIQSQLKADVDILGVLLEKYSIVSLRGNKKR